MCCVIGGLLRILIISLVLLVAALMLLPRASDFVPTIEVATMLDEPRVLPDVGLIDQHGQAFSFDDLTGQHTLVFFGFTNCPDICPLTLAVIAEAVQELRGADPDSAPEVLFVSVDPNRDTATRINSYVSAFDEHFIGATADDATLAPLLSAMGVSVHKQIDGDETYTVVHNGTIYVLDEAARWTAIFGGSEHLAANIVNDYRAIKAAAARE